MWNCIGISLKATYLKENNLLVLMVTALPISQLSMEFHKVLSLIYIIDLCNVSNALEDCNVICR